MKLYSGEYDTAWGDGTLPYFPTKSKPSKAGSIWRGGAAQRASFHACVKANDVELAPTSCCRHDSSTRRRADPRVSGVPSGGELRNADASRRRTSTVPERRGVKPLLRLHEVASPGAPQTSKRGGCSACFTSSAVSPWPADGRAAGVLQAERGLSGRKKEHEKSLEMAWSPGIKTFRTPIQMCILCCFVSSPQG